MAMEQDPTDPTGVRDDSPRGGKAVARARDRKAASALQLKIAGATWDEIATLVGYPTGHHAQIATEKALEKELRTEGSQAYMRTIAGQRLERLIRSTWKKAIDENHPEHLVAVDRARQLIDRHAKLYGLDAPTEVVVHSPTRDELERWVAGVVQAKTPALEEPDIFEVEWEETDEAVEG